MLDATLVKEIRLLRFETPTKNEEHIFLISSLLSQLPALIDL